VHHIIVTSCRVQPEKMKEFFGHIRQWEHAVTASEHPAEHHALYVNDADPSRVLMLTRFESAAHAAEFTATGLLDQFRDRILSCTAGVPNQEAYDLYYATGPGGPHVVFGEESDPA